MVKSTKNKVVVLGGVCITIAYLLTILTVEPCEHKPKKMMPLPGLVMPQSRLTSQVTNKTEKNMAKTVKTTPKTSHSTSGKKNPGKKRKAKQRNRKKAEAIVAAKRHVLDVFTMSTDESNSGRVHAASEDGSSCVEELRKKFNKFWPTENPTALFQTFETYKASLPVRLRQLRIGQHEWLKLHELPYFCSDTDVRSMASQLEVMPSELGDGSSDVRNLVKYVCAPAGSGKTSSILPAFLQSNFTHYLYIACANNNNRKFNLDPYKPFDDRVQACRQGAAFALQCVNMLLMEEKPRAFSISIKEQLTQEIATEKLVKLIRRHFGKDSRVLFHVDEHRQMCYRSGAAHDPGAYFSRGAMETLAGAGTVVATYTEPPSIPVVITDASSGICRLPVALPCVDVDKVLRYVGIALPATTNAENKRLLALLRLRIQIALQSSGLGMGGLHRLGSSPRHKDMFDNLGHALSEMQNMKQRKQSGRETNGETKILRKCINVCPMPSFSGITPHRHATQLLRGMSDDQVEKAGRELNNLVVLPYGRISTTIFRLLSFRDVNAELDAIYVAGRERFYNALLNDTDALSARPLEEAYLWTLSCQSVSDGLLCFTDFTQKRITFNIKCTKTKPGRIFPSDVTTNFDVNHLQRDTIYYADEPARGGQHAATHPLADMFFRTAKDHLVLIDITGTLGCDKVGDKVRALGREITSMQEKLDRRGEWMEKDPLHPTL